MAITLRRLASESWLTTRASPFITSVMACLVAVMSLVVFLTAGRAAGLEADIMDEVDASGTRVVLLYSERQDGGIDPAIVDRIENIRGVEWVLGFGPSIDATNANLPGSQRVASRTVYGDLSSAFQIQEGFPRDGQALITNDSRLSLGLAFPSGTIVKDGSLIPVSGQIEPTDEFEEMRKFILIFQAEPRPEYPLAMVFIKVNNPTNVQEIAQASIYLAGDSDQSTLKTQTSEILIELERVLSGELGGFSRQIAIGALIIGITLIIMSLVMSTNSRKQDFGRKRVLGATRVDLILSVLSYSMIPITIGAIAGSAGGMIALKALHYPVPDVLFVFSCIYLIIIVSTLGALPAAILAGLRDPVSVLRTP